jgi:hypothetical protein
MATTATNIIEHSPDRNEVTKNSRAPIDPVWLTAKSDDLVLTMMGFGIFPECYAARETDPILHLRSFGVFPEAYH